MTEPLDDTRPSQLSPLISLDSVGLPHGGRDLPDNLTLLIGQRVQALRAPYGLSQREAAELLGISQPALSKIESGQSTPSLATLLRLQAVFRLDSVEAVLGELPSRLLADAAFGRGQMAEAQSGDVGG